MEEVPMQDEKVGKELKLDSFEITGDIMKWDGSIVKIQNISYITNNNFKLPSFPALSIILILFGIALANIQQTAGIGCIGVGVIWIVYWYYRRESLKSKALLMLAMNSGTQIPILFRNKKFLAAVLTVLEEVMKAGNIGQQNIKINIQGCDISGNARILSDMNIH